MTRVYFHSQQRTVDVRGSERAYFGLLCKNIVERVISTPSDYDDFERRRLQAFKLLLGADHYLVQECLESSQDTISFRGVAGISASFDFEQGVKNTLHSMITNSLLGERIGVSELALNSAIVSGSDALKLAARLHGQCEIHTYVEGENRGWLADIIENALIHGIYRSGQGWEKVIELLREENQSPVVTSFSVSETFPNAYAANWQPIIEQDGGPNWDAYYDLSEEEQWAIGMEALRGEKFLEITPNTWESFYFDHGWDVFKLNRLIDLVADISKSLPEVQQNLYAIVDRFNESDATTLRERWQSTVEVADTEL